MKFRIGDCRITVGFPFLAVIALVLALDRSGVAFIGLVCAALHEAAHIAAMRSTGGMPREMRFTAFGIDLVRPSEKRSYGRDALVSFAGPAANLAAAGLCFILFQRKFEIFLAANLLLFGLNILPVEPLDGGQALLSLLCLKMEPEKAGGIVSAVSFFALIPLAAAGFFVLLRSRWNFTLLFAACYLTALLLMKRER